MFVAIIADSHGAIDRLEILLEKLQNAGVKYVLHAGDFLVDGVDIVLAKFPKLKIFIARGNDDLDLDLLERVRDLPHVVVEDLISQKIGGKFFLMAHTRGDLVRGFYKCGGSILCFGHTHKPQAFYKYNTLYLNPGALYEDGTYFLFRITDGKIARKHYLEKI